MTPVIAVVHRLLSRALRIGQSMLREIFDESAYARFLQRRQLANSPQAYAEFLVEHEARAQRRPRCC
jgi:hypothetical protein